MAFKARLNFSGKEYDLRHCAYALNRDVAVKGIPSSGVHKLKGAWLCQSLLVCKSDYIIN